MPRALALALAAALLAVPSCKRHRHAPRGSAAPAPSATDAAPPANAVQAEMRLLRAAMQAAAGGVADNDVRAVGPALRRVHDAREATEDAVLRGYAPPKGTVARFKELDEAFHGRLESLEDASRANDVAKVAASVGPVLQACQACHAELRR